MTRLWHRVWIALVIATGVILEGCGSPLGTASQWLVGSWRWTGSISGFGHVSTPDAPNALVIALHEDGRAVVMRYDVVALETSYDVDVALYRPAAIAIRFAHRIPELNETSHVIREPNDPVTGASRFTLSNGARDCDDCLELAGFTRLQ
jgi:hypothetical protein